MQIAPRVYSFLAAALLLAIASVAGAEPIKVREDLVIESNPSVKGTFNLAHGLGFIYGPIIVAEQLGLVEKTFPNAKIQWQNIFLTTQQRDAMLADRLDYGTCTAGPYLQGWDKGVDWKWVQTVSGFDAYLMVRPDGPNSILDFIGTSRRLSPGTNTAQYFTTQELLRKLGKDPKILDHNWVNLPHPDAMAALMAGQLDGHFATFDFALRLVAAGMKKITSIKDVYGSLYPVGVCGLSKTVKEQPEFVKGYIDALRKTVEWMNHNPEEAAKVLAESTGNKLSAAQALSYLKSPTYASYTTDADLKSYAVSMHAVGALGRVPKEPSDVYAFPEDAGAKW